MRKYPQKALPVHCCLTSQRIIQVSLYECLQVEAVRMVPTRWKSARPWKTVSSAWCSQVCSGNGGAEAFSHVVTVCKTTMKSWEHIPSGKRTVCYWKWPFIVDLPIKNDVFMGPIEGWLNQNTPFSPRFAVARRKLKERAEDEAFDTFGRNLKKKLLSPPRPNWRSSISHRIHVWHIYIYIYIW